MTWKGNFRQRHEHTIYISILYLLSIINEIKAGATRANNAEAIICFTKNTKKVARKRKMNFSKNLS